MKAVFRLAVIVGLAVAWVPLRAHESEGLGKDLLLANPFPYPVGASASQPATSPPLALVAHVPLPGPSGDLWVHRNLVAVGNWRGATTGVKLIDITNPARPVLLPSLPARPGTTYEDPMILGVETPHFRGDLLAVGLQYGSPGVEFWDVTDPRQPKLLSFFPTPGTIGVHELFLTRQRSRVLALLATLDTGLQIVDVTDPTKPLLLSVWELTEQLKIRPLLGAGYPASFCHSVSASADGVRAYLSYWDAGAILLDISDPTAPRFLGRTIYPVGQEGDTHSAVEADGGSLLITTDEDFDPTPTANHIQVTAPERLAGRLGGIELGFTQPLTKNGPLRGQVVDVGSALPGVDLKADPRGKIALLDPTPARQGQIEQIRRVQAAGAIGILFTLPQLHSGRPDDQIAVPGMSLFRETTAALRQALAASERVEIEMTPGEATWGYVRLWDIRDPSKPVQVGRFATPATSQFPLPRRGWFSVHNPFVHGNRLYASWYSEGVRVIDITDPKAPREIAHFLPPVDPVTPTPLGPFPLVWGVVRHNGLILMSDMQTGLWIVRDAP